MKKKGLKWNQNWIKIVYRKSSFLKISNTLCCALKPLMYKNDVTQFGKDPFVISHRTAQG